VLAVRIEDTKTNDMLAGEYAREALKSGLAIEARLGTNLYNTSAPALYSGWLL
jgi:hypothetical protein